MAKASTSSKPTRKKTKATRAAKIAPAKTTVMQSARIRTWSSVLAVLYALEGIAILVASTSYRVPVTVSYLGQDTLASQATGQPVIVGATRHLFDFNLTGLVVAYLFVAALAYASAAYLLRNHPVEINARRQNSLRLTGYAVSSGIMMIVIGFVSGVYDLASLIMLFSLQVISGLLWLGAIRYDGDVKGRLKGWMLYWLGVVAAVVPWIVFAIYASSNLVYGSGVPTYVNAIYDSIFALFVGVGVNLYLQRKRISRWADGWYGDRVFMVLSFVALSALAWLVFFGILHS